MLEGKAYNLRLEPRSGGIIGALTIEPKAVDALGDELKTMFFIDEEKPGYEILGSYVLAAIQSHAEFIRERRNDTEISR